MTLSIGSEPARAGRAIFRNLTITRSETVLPTSTARERALLFTSGYVANEAG